MAADPVMPSAHPGEILLEALLVLLGVSQYQLRHHRGSGSRPQCEVLYQRRSAKTAGRWLLPRLTALDRFSKNCGPYWAPCGAHPPGGRAVT